MTTRARTKNSRPVAQGPDEKARTERNRQALEKINRRFEPIITTALSQGDFLAAAHNRQQRMVVKAQELLRSVDLELQPQSLTGASIGEYSVATQRLIDLSTETAGGILQLELQGAHAIFEALAVFLAAFDSAPSSGDALANLNYQARLVDCAHFLGVVDYFTDQIMTGHLGRLASAEISTLALVNRIREKNADQSAWHPIGFALYCTFADLKKLPANLAEEYTVTLLNEELNVSVTLAGLQKAKGRKTDSMFNAVKAAVLSVQDGSANAVTQYVREAAEASRLAEDYLNTIELPEALQDQVFAFMAALKQGYNEEIGLAATWAVAEMLAREGENSWSAPNIMRTLARKKGRFKELCLACDRVIADRKAILASHNPRVARKPIADDVLVLASAAVDRAEKWAERDVQAAQN